MCPGLLSLPGGVFAVVIVLSLLVFIRSKIQVTLHRHLVHLLDLDASVLCSPDRVLLLAGQDVRIEWSLREVLNDQVDVLLLRWNIWPGVEELLVVSLDSSAF